MLNTLNQILKKEGSEYVDRLLSENVIITEKLDTYRILFENVDGEIKFFKKDNTELELIERVLTNIWEDAIVELSVILEEHKDSLPQGVRFGLAYTPVEKPIRLIYKSIPAYILTDITTRKNNKVVHVYDEASVFEWATALSLGRPPVIFQGKLNEDQKRTLISYASEFTGDEKPLSDMLKEKFQGTYSNEQLIEGIIIKSGDRLAQIVSYEFDLLNEQYEKEEFSRDFYDLTIMNLNSFLDKYNFPILEGKNPEDLYLEMVCDIFNNYCENSSVTENMLPEYLTPPKFGYNGDLNTLLLKNKKTISILENGNKVHESIFKVILSSLRKYKKEYGLLNEAAVQKFNTYVYLISEKMNKPLDPPENIVAINEARSENIVVDAVNKKMASDIDNMRVIASIQKAFEPKGEDMAKGKEKCVVYLTEFRPFTQAQAENILGMQKMWNCPVVLASIENRRRVTGEKFFFSDNLMKAQIKAFADANKEAVPAYFVLSDWDLYGVFNFCRPRFEPAAIITDKGKKADLVLQLYFEEEIMSQRLGVIKDFNIGEMENKDQLLAFRSIEDNVFYNFKELVPPSILGLYDSMQSEWKTWNGKILRK
jgi:hypothetical protein